MFKGNILNEIDEIKKAELRLKFLLLTGESQKNILLKKYHQYEKNFQM